MLQTPEEYDIEQINKKSWEVAKQYVIEPSDLLSIEVYSDKGERIIDPDFELTKDMEINQADNKPNIEYQVSSEGVVKLPMVGTVMLSGLDLRIAENKLEEKYKEFYNEPFVNITYMNKRVIVVGETNLVVPLTNENMHLIEVLALADAVNNNAKVQNIRVVRGEYVFVMDLSRIEGLKKTNMLMQPGDIVYVEPVRRPFVESIRDYSPMINVITGVAIIISILTR